VKQIDTITIDELTLMAKRMYGNLIKAVVDIKQGLLVVDAELHVDEEQFLLENGSKQNDLWGVNLYPESYGTADFIEFDSMVNIRPSQNNMSRGVESKTTQAAIIHIIEGKIKK
jgi:hypothetical protein